MDICRICFPVLCHSNDFFLHFFFFKKFVFVLICCRCQEAGVCFEMTARLIKPQTANRESARTSDIPRRESSFTYFFKNKCALDSHLCICKFAVYLTLKRSSIHKGCYSQPLGLRILHTVLFTSSVVNPVSL